MNTPPWSHPAGDLDSQTGWGFRARRVLTHTLMSPAHVFSRSRGKSSALFTIKSQRRKKKSGSGSLFLCESILGSVGRSGEEINQPNRKVSVCSVWQFWMWDGPRHCWNYLAGSFENSSLLRTGWPRLLCISLRQWAKRFCKKERSLHSLYLVWGS